VNERRAAIFRRLIGPTLLAVGLTLLSLSIPSLVSADYTVGTGPYPGLGSSGGDVQDQGVSELNPYGAMSTWNSWTGTSKLSWGTDCGDCIIFANEFHTLTYTSCDIPGVDDSGGGFAFAVTHYLVGDPYYNTIQDEDCDDIGSFSAPVYIVTLNVSLDDYDSTAEAHIALHEMAHGLGIDDTSTSCWSTDWLVYPLMHKSYPAVNCEDGEGNDWRDNYYDYGWHYMLLNYWATANEKQKVKDVNVWRGITGL